MVQDPHLMGTFMMVLRRSEWRFRAPLTPANWKTNPDTRVTSTALTDKATYTLMYGELSNSWEITCFTFKFKLKMFGLDILCRNLKISHALLHNVS